MSDVIAAAGLGWPKLKEKIRFGSMSFLRGCLEESDIAIPCGDGFLVIFASADQSEVNRRTQELRDLMVQFYLGEEGLDRLRVEANRQTLPARALHALAAEEALIQEASGAANQRRFLFAPIWQTQRQAIVAYFCSPIVTTPTGLIHAYGAAYRETGELEDDDFLAVDLGALEHACLHLEMVPAGPGQPAIGVAVHASTMLRKLRRVLYLRQLTEIARRHPRLASVCISEIGRGTPISTIADWVGQLRSSVRFVYLQFHHCEPPPLKLEAAGATGAGFSAPLGISETGAADQAFIQRVTQWSVHLARRRMVLYIDDVRPRWLIERAGALGIHLISSPLWPSVAQPGLARLAPLGEAPG